jgi:hypothetical protein
MNAPLVHVAVEKSHLEGVVTCPVNLLQSLVPLLERLGPLTNHPGLMSPHSIDSIGKWIEEDYFEECRERLVSGSGMRVVYKIRKFDVLFCEASEKLSSAQRRQCVAVRGTNEVARRLDPDERGSAEISVAFPGGGVLAVRKHKNTRRLVVLLTSVKKKKKVLEAELAAEDEPKLVALFEQAAKGERQALVAPRTTSRFVQLEKGSYWDMPAWYSEAVAVLAQDVFRLHALVSSTSLTVSKAIFIDRVTAHRMDGGPIDTHRTLVKGILHRASGGCACALHHPKASADRFQRLEIRMEFCGGCIDGGKCNRHWNAEGPLAQSPRFPGVCMQSLKVELRCAHETSGTARGGIRLPLNVADATMDIGFAKSFVVDLAACGATLMRAGLDTKDVALDMNSALDSLADARLRHNHAGDQMQQRDCVAVYLLRNRSAVNKNGRFAGHLPANCNAILKTHRHLFKVKA